jgi:Leucine-rich repeat (LRR) protein
MPMSLRVVLLAAIAIAIIGGFRVDAAFAAQGPKEKEDFVVEVVESKFKLPPSSEARWTKERQELLDRNRKTMRDAYDKIGKRDPKWNDSARAALDAMTMNFSQWPRPVPTHDDVFVLAKKAIDAGCDDPMVLYVLARVSNARNVAGNEEYRRRWLTAGAAMGKSGYSDFRRSLALLSTASVLAGPQGGDPEKSSQFAEEALDAYLLALKKERRSFGNDLMRGQALGLAGIFARLKGSEKTGRDHVDEALSDVPDAKLLRVQMRAEHQIDSAWKARGGGFADTVTAEGFREFTENLKAAHESLHEAWKLDPTDSWAPTTMLRVLKGLGERIENFDDELKTWFERAMNADPDNIEACQEMLEILDPKWHGSAADVVAFGRECAKSENVLNRIPLLILDAHARAVLRRPNAEKHRYLARKDVRKEIDDVVGRYFKAVPDDHFEQAHVAMHLYFAGLYSESQKWFDRSERHATPTYLYTTQDLVAAQKYVRQLAIDSGEIKPPYKHWEKLSPPHVDRNKSDDVLMGQWVLAQGGSISYDVPSGRKFAASLHQLPEEDFELAVVRLTSRTLPIEMPSIDGCKKLFSLSFRRVDLRPSEAKRFGKLPVLRDLELADSPEVGDALVSEIVRGCPSLRVLKVDDTQITEQTLREMSSRKLSVLTLAGTEISNKQIESLKKFTQLTYLNLKRTKFSLEEVRTLSDSLPNCRIDSDTGFVQRLGPRPKKLEPPSTDSNKTDDRLLAEWILTQAGSVTFAISTGKRQVRQMDDLPREPFEIVSAAVPGRKAPKEMPSIAGCKKLENLNLASFDLRLSEVLRFRELPNMKVFVVSNALDVNDEMIAEIVKRCPNLTTLSLDNTGVTDEATPKIASLKNLKWLTLNGTKITDRSVAPLSAASMITHLDINRTKISADGLERLRDALPKATISPKR